MNNGLSAIQVWQRDLSDGPQDRKSLYRWLKRLRFRLPLLLPLLKQELVMLAPAMDLTPLKNFILHAVPKLPAPTAAPPPPRWSQTYRVNPLALCQCGFWLSQQLLAISGELLTTTPELRPVSFLDRKTLAKSAKTFRRFEAERPNQIWQSDILYGPYLPDPNQPEKNKRTYLVAFIDDFSRLVPHAEFYWDEKFPALENTLKIAMLKRGVPECIYVDNGKVYSARRLDAICAALGIRKISCQPYSPEGKTREIILCHSLFMRKLLLSHVSRAKSSAFLEPCAKIFWKSRKAAPRKHSPSSTSSSGRGWKWTISSASTAARRWRP